ncbi:FAD/NAD(P)-binding domain-containing protein [Calocera viscosa TUFC12733]|uniref:FAD/NAD(P)-binding domain-containing protein n=1 Tax=Calocera viscosa (strain TUFC12733) TaxID=1330018 RepID=A0A167M1H9_CALVF|nr:FAD/NAD(P)-binding domain-containing protein [Calocera viscosa TUFC12733]
MATSATPPSSVLIIGAGPGGLCLALSLSLLPQHIPCTVYDLHPSTPSIGGAVALTPSSLRILDRLGVYERIKHRGFQYRALRFATSKGGTIGDCIFGTEQYPALRISRTILLQALHDVAAEQGIHVQWGKKALSLQETEEHATVTFEDGTSATGDMVVGFDGVHSRVRAHVVRSALSAKSTSNPDAYAAQFAGLAGVQFLTPLPLIRFPPPPGHAEGTPPPLPMLILAQEGSFLLFPSDPEGQEVACFSVWNTEVDLGREGWERWGREEAVRWVRELHKGWPEPVKSALESLDPSQVHVWPAYSVPPLPAWHSPRVIIAGDAAHAFSPKGGQGAGQALEDAALLSRSLFLVSPQYPLAQALRVWEARRRERVKFVLDWASRADRGRREGKSGWVQQKIKEYVLWAVFALKGEGATRALIGYDTELVDLGA